MAWNSGVTGPSFGKAAASAAAGAAPGILASMAGGAAAGSVVPVWGTILGAGIGLFSSLFGAHKQASSYDKAAKLQTDAQLKAAQLSKQAADEALAETRREADRTYASAQSAQRNNYNQWRDREERLSQGGESVGLPRRTISDYVPDPGGSAGAGAATGAGAMPDLTGAQSAFETLFPDETLTPAMLSARKAELEAAGFTLRPNAAGVVGKVQYRGGPIIDVIQGAGSGLNRRQWLVGEPARTSSPALTANAPQTIGDLAVPAWKRRAPRTAALMPGSVADYAVGRY